MENIKKNDKRHKKLYLKITILLIIIVVAFEILMLAIIKNTTHEKLTPNNTISNESNLNSNDNVSSGITKITAINYYSDSNNPTTYTIVELEKINEIIKLFANANWKDTIFTDEYHCSWYIKMEGNTEAEFFMQGVPVVKVKTNGKEKMYEIDEIKYKEILSAFNIRYYLHKSDLEKPEKSEILNLQEQIFKDLTDKEILEIQNTLRLTHVNMEYQLLDAVNIIKDSNSPYWEQANYGGKFTDPLTNVVTDYSDYCFNTNLKNLENIKNIIKDEETKKEIENIIVLLKKSMENHDLTGCFKAHEFIHDYDYYLINYPAYFPTSPPPDWEGINVYFGHLKLQLSMQNL